MTSFDGKVAVITGAAGGIGRSMAIALAEHGADVVVTDHDETRLDSVVDELSTAHLHNGRRAIGVGVDVTDRAAVQSLADTAYEEFGAVHFLHNNAGVFSGGATWDVTDDEWQWLWNVNVMGLVNGIRAFVPRMVESGVDGHVVNTASTAGLIANPYSAPYTTTKFAAVGLTECLHHDLSLVESCRIKVSVVCPGIVNTALIDNSDARPAPNTERSGRESHRTAATALTDAMSSPGAVTPDVAAERILEGVRAGQFYIATHDSFSELVGHHNEDLLARRPPRFQMID